MREIKFRGHNGIEWLYDSQISIIPYGKNVHCFMPNEKNKSDQNDVCNWDSVSYVGQYTGCKDANGKEIYEGDIIRLEGVDDREIGSTWEHIGKIVYKRGAFFVCYFDYYADGDEELICDAQVEFGTVIGNIYENKNLLEENYE
jgi:uncharacterized phage protein (TIGR01671 family)